eukprot:13982148-Ditylum_brightwellii.AAC.1
MPAGRRATYGRIVCNYRPQKADLNRVRLTVGGDCVEHPFEVSKPTADFVTAKLLMNFVISTEGAKFLTIDINTFIATPQWSTVNICASNMTSCHMKLSQNMNLMD